MTVYGRSRTGGGWEVLAAWQEDGGAGDEAGTRSCEVIDVECDGNGPEAA
jgi:hypothetical protein